MFKKGDSRVDRKMMTTSLNNFYGKAWDGFVLTRENASSQRFYLKANRKILCSSKKRY